MDKAEAFIRHFFLSHDDAPYDPVQAHEYYLRTRDLKGRQQGIANDPSKTSSASPLATPKVDNSAEQLRQQAHEKFLALTEKLKKLKKVLEGLVKEAKANSAPSANASPGSAPASAPSGSSTSSATKLSPQDKAKAAQAAKDYYEQHKNDKKLTPEEQIKDIETKIQDVRDKILKLINDRQERNGLDSREL